jgi:hypothetical protein
VHAIDPMDASMVESMALPYNRKTPITCWTIFFCSGVRLGSATISAYCTFAPYVGAVYGYSEH